MASADARRCIAVAAVVLWSVVVSALPAVSAVNDVEDVAGLANPLDVTGGSARAVGLGSAFVGVADDSSAILWNPAGLGGLRGVHLAAHHTAWLADITQETVVAAMPLGSLGVIGVSGNYVHYGEFPGYDEGGVQVGDYAASRYGMSLGWGDEIVRTLQAGLAVRGSMQTADRITQSALSADVGALWSVTDRLRVGAVYANIGTAVAGYTLASAVRAGASYWMNLKASHRLLLAAAATVEPGGVNRLHLGVEDVFRSVVAVRLGYQANLAEDEITGITGLSGGLGVRYRGLGLDYAFLPFGDLGQTQRISLSYHFGGER